MRGRTQSPSDSATLVAGLGTTAAAAALDYRGAVSVKDPRYGAIMDGTSHPVSEWLTGSGVAWSKGYANLTAIQVDYPLVAALTDEIDWAAFQKAVGALRRVIAPAGTALFHKRLTLSADNTLIDGDGEGLTVLKLKSGANDRLIYNSSTTNSGLRNLTLDGNRTNNTGGTPSATKGYYGTATTRAVLSSVEIINTTAEGFFEDSACVDTIIDGKPRFDNCSPSGAGVVLSQANLAIRFARITSPQSSPLVQIASGGEVYDCRLKNTVGSFNGIVATGDKCLVTLNDLDWSSAALGLGTAIVTYYNSVENVIIGNKGRGMRAGVHVGGSGGGAAAVTASRHMAALNLFTDLVNDGILAGNTASIDTGDHNMLVLNLIARVRYDSGDVNSRGVGVENHLAYTMMGLNSVYDTDGHALYSAGKGTLGVVNIGRKGGQLVSGEMAGFKVTGSFGLYGLNITHDNGYSGNTGSGILVSAETAFGGATDNMLNLNHSVDTRAGGKLQKYGLRGVENGGATSARTITRDNFLNSNANLNHSFSTSGALGYGENYGHLNQVSNYNRTTQSWTPGAIPAGQYAEVLVGVTSAASTDTIIATYNQALVAGLVLKWSYSATNTVSVRIENYTSGTLTPPAGTVTVTSWR